VTRSISGAHLNPAVTTALVSTGKFAAEDAPPYVLAQCAGAAAAGAMNYLFFRNGIAAMEAGSSIVRGTAASTASFSGAFGMVPNAALVGPAGAFVAEVYATALLVFLICGIGDSDKGSVPSSAAPALVGGVVATLIGTFGPLTGAGLNPARDLGPRLVTVVTGWGGAATTAWWVYTLGPIVGGVLGGLCYEQIFAEPAAAPLPGSV